MFLIGNSGTRTNLFYLCTEQQGNDPFFIDYLRLTGFEVVARIVNIKLKELDNSFYHWY